MVAETPAFLPEIMSPPEPKEAPEYVPTPTKLSTSPHCGLNKAPMTQNCMPDRQLLSTCDLPVGTCPPEYEEAIRACGARASALYPECGKTSTVIR